MKRRTAFFVFLSVFAALTLVACGGKDFEASPDEVENAMLASFFGEKDAILALVCEDAGRLFSASQAEEGATFEIDCVREDDMMLCTVVSPGQPEILHFDFEIVDDKLCNLSLTSTFE